MQPRKDGSHSICYNKSMSWASQRKFLYVTGVLLACAAIASIPLIMWLYEPATCFDGIKNQTESDVDRGGPCKLLDPRRLIPHSVLWTRPFLSRGGIFSAVAYIENPNKNAGVREAAYRMKIYDDKNVLVGEREGVMPIMPGTITPIFEGEMGSENRTATRAFFEFIAPLVWERLADRSGNIDVTNKLIKDPETAPRVSATLINNDVENFRDVIVVAAVFDQAGNAFAASQTIIPEFDARASIPVTFTWPQGFTQRVARVDVIPVIPPTDIE